jgi:hypothetical protein
VVAPVSQLNQLVALEAAVASTAATAASPLAGLQPGAVIAARVLALLEGGQVQLAIGNAVIEATTQVPLPLGATVQLAVQTTGNATTLQFVGTAAPQATATSTPQATPANAAALSTAAPPTVPQPPAVAIPVPSMGNAANGAPATAGTPAVAAATAVSDATMLATPAQLTAAAAPQLAPAAAADATVALQAAVQVAAARQGSLSPLFAEVAAAANLPALPEPVRREALRLLSLRPQLDGNLTAADLKQAFANSGLLLEAHLAETVQPSPDHAAAGGANAGGTNGASNSAAGVATNAGAAAAALAALPQDLKAALIMFRQLLAQVLSQDPANTGGEGAGTIPDAAAGPLASESPSSTASAAAASPSAGRAAQSAPPPFRGGPTAAQLVAAATIDASTPPHEAVKTLLAATEGALSRQTLLQAASLPSQPGGASHASDSGPRWLFEVPFATPQGTNVAQFEIARDGRAAKPAEGVGPVWQARFSIDIEPIGPVHAQIALRGMRTAVTLWAENPAGAAQLRAGAGKLSDALRAADLEAGDLVVRDGAPRARTMPAGHFLDRAS